MSFFFHRLLEHRHRALLLRWRMRRKHQGPRRVQWALTHALCLLGASAVLHAAGPGKLHTDDRALILHSCDYQLFPHVDDKVIGRPRRSTHKRQGESVTCERHAGRTSNQSWLSAATHLYPSASFGSPSLALVLFTFVCLGKKTTPSSSCALVWAVAFAALLRAPLLLLSVRLVVAWLQCSRSC